MDINGAELHMEKSDKIILGIILASIPLGLILFFTYSMIFGPTIKEAIIRSDSLENVNGLVDTLFNDDRNHDVRTAILKNNHCCPIKPKINGKA